MVKVVVDNQIFQCRDYEWVTNGIILYDAVCDGSLWKYVEIRSIEPIAVFKDETVLETTKDIFDFVDFFEREPW